MTKRLKGQAPEASALDFGSTPGVTEEIEVRGHIVDSLLLPKILDRILLMSGTFEIRECKIGVHRADPSYARIAIKAENQDTLDAILGDLVEHGASPIHPEDATTLAADIAGAFPDGFYSTTNQPTQIRLFGRWVDVLDQEMDCGIVIERQSSTARCIPMNRVAVGMPIVVGHAGIRVLPVERPRDVSLFGFMSSNVSSEKPKSMSARTIVDAMRATRAEGKKVLLVGGPAIVHTGSAGHVARLIRDGWVQVLFAGNALATHDHRTGALWHQSGRFARAGRADRARSRAPPARDQHHPAAGGNPPGGREGRAHFRHHVRVRQGRAWRLCWPARSATTARCPR